MGWSPLRLFLHYQSGGAGEWEQTTVSVMPMIGWTALLATGAVKRHDAVERIGVGQRQMAHTIVGGTTRQLGHTRRAAEQGEVRMDFEMCESHDYIIELMGWLGK